MRLFGKGRQAQMPADPDEGDLKPPILMTTYMGWHCAPVVLQDMQTGLFQGKYGVCFDFTGRPKGSTEEVTQSFWIGNDELEVAKTIIEAALKHAQDHWLEEHGGEGA